MKPRTTFSEACEPVHFPRSKPFPLVAGLLCLTLAAGASNALAGAIHDAFLFTGNTLAANDDGSTGPVNIGFTINFFGTSHSTLFVNNNGNVTFNASLGTFTPFNLLLTNTPILAPFFADVDTTGTGSGLVQYGQNTLSGRSVFGVNWINVGYFGANTDKLNSFQLILVNRADVRPGDFDFEFNYDKIQWETGDASDGTGGLGGSSARAGWSDGVANALELPGSAVNGALLDGGPNSLVAGSLNSNTPGRYIFAVRGGQVGALIDLSESLSTTGRAVTAALRQSELVLAGAHGRALGRRTGPGENIFWVAGDWGRDDYGRRSGSLGLAEVGVGRNLGALQLNAALGQTWNSQNLPFQGGFDHKATYALLESLVPLSTYGDSSFWVTIGGYYSWGEAQIRRGYVVNFDQLDHSTGTPDASLTALRARLDWDNAWRLGNASISPYAEVVHTTIRLAGYEENGGAFRARFDARKDATTEFRLGIDASKPLFDSVKLLGRLEANHRLDGLGPRTTGEVPTVSAFGFDGIPFERSWLHVGAGVEAKLGPGTGSVMLNATSRGEAPSSWIAANWQMAF